MTAVSRPDGDRAGRAPAQVLDSAQQPEATVSAVPRGWLRSPVNQGGLALVIYLLAWLPTAYRPLLQHVGHAVLNQQSMDPNFYVWSLRWWPFAVSHGLDPLFTRQISAPAGHSLAWVTTVPPIALLAAPLTLLAGPIAAFNLLNGIALPLSGWAAFVLCRRLTGKFWPSLAGGTVFGFSAFEMNHVSAGQLNLTYSLLLPVLAYLIVVWWQGAISSRVFVGLAALTLTVQFYLFLETFADLTGVLIVGLIVAFALAGRQQRPTLLRLARVTALAYAIAIAIAVPYLAFALTSRPPKPARITGTDLASLVIPRPGRTFGIAWLARLAARPDNVSAACYIGIPLLIVVVVLAVTSWSSRLVRVLTVMLAFTVVASVGPIVRVEGRNVLVLPWAPLFHAPFLRNAYPARLMLFAFLALAVIVALLLARPVRWVNWARWPLAVLVVAFVALDTIPLQIQPHTSVPAFITAGDYSRQLARGETVVVVSNVGNAAMLWQAQTDFYLRVAGGYINAGLNHRTDLPTQVQVLARATPSAVRRFERYVKTHHIGAVLVDVHYEPQWVGIFWRMGLKGHDLGNVIVYKLNQCQTCKALDWAGLGKAPPASS